MNRYENADIKNLIVACREHNDTAFDELVARYTPMMRKVNPESDKAQMLKKLTKVA